MPSIHTHPHIFTPTQRRMMEVLADGRPHSRAELIACTMDGPDHGTWESAKVHICYIRKKIRPLGEDVCPVMVDRILYYRLVRLIQS